MMIMYVVNAIDVVDVIVNVVVRDILSSQRISLKVTHTPLILVTGEQEVTSP